MTNFWPPELVQSLAQRRGIVFLGAGASASCASQDGRRLPNWKRLLEDLASDLNGRDLEAFNDFMSRSRYLDAAQVISDVTESVQVNNRLISIFGDGTIRPGEVHKHINLLDQPVLMTTNYDRLYERYWELELNTPLTGAKPPLMVSTYVDNDVVDNLRSDRPLLLKLHGSVEKPRNLVLSRSQYSRAKFDYPNFFRIVSALLLTRTVLFVGCGFNGDPDIELLLEDSAFTARSVAPHYAITPRGRHESETRSIREAFNVKLLEYDNDDGNHAELTARLAELSQLVEDARI